MVNVTIYIYSIHGSYSIIDHVHDQSYDINSQKWKGDLWNYYCILSIGVHLIWSRHDVACPLFGGEKPQSLSVNIWSLMIFRTNRVRLLLKNYTLCWFSSQMSHAENNINAFQIRILSLKLTSLLPKIASFLVRIISLSAQNPSCPLSVLQIQAPITVKNPAFWPQYAPITILSAQDGSGNNVFVSPRLAMFTGKTGKIWWIHVGFTQCHHGFMAGLYP